MGSHPHPPYRVRGRLFDRARRGRGGRRAQGRLRAGSALSRRGPVEGEGDGVPPGMGSRLHGNDGWHGESPSPQPSPGKGEGDGVPPGMGSRLRGNDGWHGESPSPQPSPVKGEGDGVPPGMGSRLHGNDGGVWHGGVTLTPRIEYGAGSSTLRQAQESQAQDRLRLLTSRERRKSPHLNLPPQMGEEGDRPSCMLEVMAGQTVAPLVKRP